MKKIRIFLFAAICLLMIQSAAVYAQTAKLGIQGILKKANGNAVDDGEYSLTFKLYDVATAGTALWTETQPDVEVASGIYTATLGSVTALNVPFDKTYYLGVTVAGSTEMQPRIQLTTAPYALSLIGSSNQFPSSGTVKADNEIVAGKLAVGQATLPSTQSVQVNGGILARGGAPGGSGGSNNGYAFSGGSGDTDSGLFSTGDGIASLYTNNVEGLRVSGGGSGTSINLKGNTTVDNSLTVSDQLTVTGVSTINSDVTLQNGANLVYKNGTTSLNDWRLVLRDDFATGLDGWKAYVSTNSSTEAAAPTRSTLGEFSTNSLIGPTNADHVLKKEYNLSGIPHEYIMVKFNFYFADSWDNDDYDRGYAGFAFGLAGTVEFAWSALAGFIDPTSTHSFLGNASYSDHSGVYSMMARSNIGNPVVVFGAVLDEAADNENFGISNVEIWVR